MVSHACREACCSVQTEVFQMLTLVSYMFAGVADIQHAQAGLSAILLQCEFARPRAPAGRRGAEADAPGVGCCV